MVICHDQVDESVRVYLRGRPSLDREVLLR